MISEGSTFGCFQLESKGCQEVQSKIKPEKISDLSLILAAYRPGPLKSGMVDQMISNKQTGTTDLVFDDIDPILRETYGVPLFQETYMQIAQELGGFSLPEGDLLRRAMGKKDASKMAELKEKFIEGGVKLWKQLKNKST
jgi:DNA polymerase-3 subunit alpha